MLELIAMSALISAFVILLAKKVGAVEWVQINGNRFFSELAHCDFCMSWWVNVYIALIAYVATADYQMFYIPFFATPLTRFLQ